MLSLRPGRGLHFCLALSPIANIINFSGLLTAHMSKIRTFFANIASSSGVAVSIKIKVALSVRLT